MFDPSFAHETPVEQRTAHSTTNEHLVPAFPWVRHYEEGVPAQLDIPDYPLTSLLDTTAKRYPNVDAFIYYGNKITYAQFSHLANRFAIGLQRLGVRKGDRVAVALPNIPQFAIAFYGALRAGAVVVPTNPLYTEHELQHQLADSEAKVLVMLDMYYATARNIRNQTTLEHIIVTSITDFLPPLQRTLYPLTQVRSKKPATYVTAQDYKTEQTLHIMQSMLRSSHTGGIELFNLPVPTTGDDLAVLQYTGGTTGLSKGAMLTHRNLLANAMQTYYWVAKAHPAQEIALCVAPFFHAYGLTVGMNLSILGAATMILLPRFKAKEVVSATRRYRPTLFPGIPTMYIGIMREAIGHADYLQSIKYCISGAAPLPAKVQQDFEQITHGKLVEGYGLSEASPVTHCNPLTDQCRNGSIGFPLPGVEAAILHRESSEPVAIGEIGELVVKGPNIMQGYWKRPEETKTIFFDGWLRTGDIGKMDEEGYFYIVDRAKDMVVASGFNVYPREVEDVLFNHPAVSEAAVVGIADAYRGETVAAFIVLKPDIEATDLLKQEILYFCRQTLAAYKVPKIVHFRASLPKTLVGKVLRRELRDNPSQSATGEG